MSAKTPLAPLCSAGFVTAFGAHSIAAGMGAQSGNIGLTLLNLGVLLGPWVQPNWGANLATPAAGIPRLDPRPAGSGVTGAGLKGSGLNQGGPRGPGRVWKGRMDG